MCCEENPDTAKKVAIKIAEANTSAESAGQLLRDKIMPESAPLHALQHLAFLGAACMSMDAACRPHMGCVPSDTGSIVGRLAEIQESLSGDPSTSSTHRDWEPVPKAVS